MFAQFFDREDTSNAHNGKIVHDEHELRRILDATPNRPKFFIELIGDNGFKLLVGVGGEVGCVQFSPSDGNTPYFMAVSADERPETGYEEFLIGGEASQVPRRYCIPRTLASEITTHFLRTGTRKSDVTWEEI